jgi:tetratricopeptide (TPR) repeat protein
MVESTDGAESVELALEAQKLFLEALAKGGQEYQSKYVFYGLGVTCLKRREYVDAIRWEEKAVAIDEQYVPAFLSLAEAHQMMRHWVDAISAYDKAFKHFMTYYSRAGTEAARQSTKPLTDERYSAILCAYVFFLRL